MMLQWLGIAHISGFNGFWPNIWTFSVISLYLCGVHTSLSIHKVLPKQAGRCVIRLLLAGNKISVQIPLRAQHFPHSSHNINIPMGTQGKQEESCSKLAWCAKSTLPQQGHPVIDLPSPAQKNKGCRFVFRKMWDTFPYNIFFFMMVLSFLYAFIISPRDQKWLKVILSKW